MIMWLNTWIRIIRILNQSTIFPFYQQYWSMEVRELEQVGVQPFILIKLVMLYSWWSINWEERRKIITRLTQSQKQRKKHLWKLILRLDYWKNREENLLINCTHFLWGILLREFKDTFLWCKSKFLRSECIGFISRAIWLATVELGKFSTVR